MKIKVKPQMEEMDKLLCRLLWSQLQTMEMFEGTEINIDNLKTKSGLKDLYGRWLDETIAVLARNNYLWNNGSSYIAVDPTPTDIKTELQEWERKIYPLRETPYLKAQINLVETMLRVLPEILTGKIPATEVMFPNSSMELVEGIYKNNIIADYYNEVLADTVCLYIKERLAKDPSARIRLIEIGAGTGGSSTMIFQKLKPYREHIHEYCYTDISKAFLIHAEATFGPDNQYLTYRLFNVEAPVAGQGIEAGGYDIAIAANVLHATKNIHRTLQNAKAVLKKNGLLLLNEISNNSLFTHLTFGLLEGWWLYEDPELRIPGSPAISPEHWHKVLECEGFRPVVFPAQESHDLGQQIIVAESDGVVCQKQPVRPKAAPVKVENKTTAKAWQESSPKPRPSTNQYRGVTSELLREKSADYIIKLVGETLKIPAHKIDPAAPMEAYGIDSILVVQLTNKLKKTLKNISSALFFEYQTIDELVEHLIKTQKDSLINALGLTERELEAEHPGAEEEVTRSLPSHNQLYRKSRRFLSLGDSQPKTSKRQDIAIIGLSGRYPGAGNMDQYWNNLADGRNSIREIPPSRWNVEQYYDPHSSGEGNMYCKWMGLLEDIEYFDPLFFNISPSEAEQMDPQHRIFLQEGYRAFEDAGYDSKRLNNKKCGVYLGIMSNEYGIMLHKKQAPSNITGNSSAIAAARIPYFLNLKGPAIPINTACSSSLVGVHLACQALLTHEIDMALVGGITLYLMPESYVGMCTAGMLSRDGQCKTFDNSADGFVPGEGVGTLVLKRLEDAEADKDNIYGVIIGSGINQDGKTNGITAPSMNSQIELEREIYQKYGIHPESISYVEMHGTGTKLGDPIELEALSTVFKEKTSKMNYCAIGSVKTNIGHTSAAAGVAGVQKVLLCMKHKKLVPTLNFNNPNEHFNFNDSPFYVNTGLNPWETAPGRPRRACVSSFGYSGTNAHLVLEEYIPDMKDRRMPYPTITGNPVLFVLSAKSEEQLKAYAGEMKSFIEAHEDINLTDMAYSLQIGRNAMDYRLAVLANSREVLLERLEGFIGNNTPEGVLTARIKRDKDGFSVFEGDEDAETLLQTWVKKKKIKKIAELWIKGFEVVWNLLYTDYQPCRIPLPTYPFAKEYCWAPKLEAGQAGVPVFGSGSANPHCEVEKYIPQDSVSMPPHTTNLSGLPQGMNITKPDSMLLFMTGYLTNILSGILKIRPEELDPEAGFDEFGVDSIYIQQINKTLEEAFGPVPSTLFYTYKSIKELAQYFLKEHGEKIKLLFQKINNNGSHILIEEKEQYRTVKNNQNQRIENIDFEIKQQYMPDAGNNDIAIIGISGQYPQAANIDELWENLKSARDCITEIPKERWDYRKYYKPEKGVGVKSGGMYCKWGGFLPDADKFDPSFFSISPADARFMDPQERLFLQSVFACFEDAGYSRKLLKDGRAGDGRASVGVFAGVTFNNYQLYSVKELERGNLTPINSQIFSVANRVSYFFNLRGPSLSVDTACASSLYAVHLACESIKSGECEMAIAGGVNLSLHPSKYITLCVTQFASSDGRCHSFGQDGDGYVPGEGVGTVLLKPLSKAIADNDHIYGVIKGTAVNHDGKTFGYTVPNPVAQTEVIKKALEKAGVNPRSISYVEAHGTGTKLGDPIEITGLNDAFNYYTADKQYCAIGSIKSNIGHLESAAGIAQLTKVLLQMKHRKLVPTLIHSAALNPNIDFEKTPFFVQQTLEDWDQPVLRVNGREEVFPRRAGISSFGAGGVNAHIVVEEYQNRPGSGEYEEKDEGPAVMVLSAKKENNLRAYAKLLKDYLENANKNLGEAEKLGNIAYTLQIGRDPMPFRLAFTAENHGDAAAKLDMFLNRPVNDGKTGLYFGNVISGKDSVVTPPEEKIATDLYESGKIEKIAELWVKGIEIDWEKLYQHDLPRRVPLPTYPFSRDRYWIDEQPDGLSTDCGTATDVVVEQTAIMEEDKKQNKPENPTILSELCNALEGERQEMLEKYIQNLLAKFLAYNPPEVPELYQGFFDMGMESIMVEQFRALLEESLKISISDTALFDYPNITKLTEYLIKLIPFSELERQCINNEVHTDDSLLFNELALLNSSESPEDDSMSLEEVAQELRALLAKHQGN